MEEQEGDLGGQGAHRQRGDGQVVREDGQVRQDQRVDEAPSAVRVRKNAVPVLRVAPGRGQGEEAGADVGGGGRATSFSALALVRRRGEEEAPDAARQLRKGDEGEEAPDGGESVQRHPEAGAKAANVLKGNISQSAGQHPSKEEEGSLTHLRMSATK